MAESLSETILPSFLKGKFILLRIAPPKGKTVREGLVHTLGLSSYTNENGKEFKMIEVTDGPSGYEVTFPFGKRGIMATKYRGPKSWYKFRKEDDTWFQIGSNDPVTKVNEKFTAGYAEKILSVSKGWAKLSEAERDEQIDQYLYDMFSFAFAIDYSLKVEQGVPELPFVGMVTELYRRYTEPKEGAKYGNTTVTKFATAEGKERLSGKFTKVDEEIAVAIYDKLIERDEARFDPSDFIENERDEKLAA
jgi:hypothetical protein